MAGLMTGSYLYPQLMQRYAGFQAPSMAIAVDGRELLGQLDASVSRLSVELTAEYASSGCSFTLTSAYDPQRGEFAGCAALLQPGAKVEISLGYGEMTPVFLGYITSLEYDFEEDAPAIHVECMDAKGILMKTQRLEFFSQRKPSQAVEELLSAPPCSGYLSGRQVEPVPGEQCLRATMESDYEFIVRLARQYGFEFFIVGGVAYFRKRPAAGAPIMTLAEGEAMLSARVRMDAAPLVERLSVVGLSPESGQPVQGVATASGRYGLGAAPKRVLGGTRRVFYEPDVTSPKEAGERAKIILEGLARDFLQLSCRCIGLPELAPGRTIRLDGLAPDLNKTYYLISVRHFFDEDGFFTDLEGRCDSL